MSAFVIEYILAYEIGKGYPYDGIYDVEKIGIFLIKTVGEKVLYCMYQAFENHCGDPRNYADYPTDDQYKVFCTEVSESPNQKACYVICFCQSYLLIFN